MQASQAGRGRKEKRDYGDPASGGVAEQRGAGAEPPKVKPPSSSGSSKLAWIVEQKRMQMRERGRVEGEGIEQKGHRKKWREGKGHKEGGRHDPPRTFDFR